MKPGLVLPPQVVAARRRRAGGAAAGGARVRRIKPVLAAQVVAGAQAERRRAAERQEALQRAEHAARAGLEADNAALREQVGVLAEVRAKRAAADEEVIRLRTELRQKDSELAAQVGV